MMASIAAAQASSLERCALQRRRQRVKGSLANAECLEAFLRSFLAAEIAHRPKRVPCSTRDIVHTFGCEAYPKRSHRVPCVTSTRVQRRPTLPSSAYRKNACSASQSSGWMNDEIEAPSSSANELFSVVHKQLLGFRKCRDPSTFAMPTAACS
jgi:hypothetical protein